MADDNIKNILRSLPDKPGVYQHLDKDGKVLYVGKAKNLKKRVSSYFTKTPESARLHMLVKRVDDIKTIITETEFDALLLENNLIKEYQPRYNINLKDDKSYPWICIKNEPFPRIFPTRNPVEDGSEYYGPYASVKVMKTVLELIRKLYHIRTCKLNLTRENIKSGKFRVCLEYHIGNCLGPCEDKQSEADYDQDVSSARELIKGNLNGVKQMLREQMQQQAKALYYEDAQKTKEKIEMVERYQAKSTVVHPNITAVDVFSVLTDAEYGYVNYFKIIDGAILQSHTMELKKKLNESPEEILEMAIPEIRSLFKSDSKEIFLSHRIDLEIPDIKIHVPQRGDKKHLVDLSLKNARYFRMEKLKNIQIVDPDRHVKRIMHQMKEDLRLKHEPRHIECRLSGSSVVLPNPVKVPDLMAEMRAWLKSKQKLHPVEFAAEAHYRLVTIHPFVDGNGRTARLLMNMILMMEGYPPAIIRKRDRLAYISALEQAQLGGSKDAYFKLIGKAVDRSLDIYLKAVNGETDAQSIEPKLMKIGELAKAVGESNSTIRHWTKEGLLEVAEITESGYQLYAADMVERVEQIKVLKEKRYSLSEIKELLEKS